MSPYLFFVFIAVCAFTHVLGDVYMHNPRGNNDRLNEASTNRANEQRMFDSQNNAQGGYCWGPALTFYEGSILSVEWTSQHSCGGPNTACNVVLQYMCSDSAEGADETLMIRDGNGATTNAIQTGTTPGTSTYYNQKDSTTGEFIYGLNEPMSVYQSCIARERNKGLFVADQNVNNNNGAMATRQNAGATLYGLECTEERDYYPYWHPSVWKDIAVLVGNTDDCNSFTSQSQNVMSKNFCNLTSTGDSSVPNNQKACSLAGGHWATVPSWGMGKPDCQAAPFNRDNHLGNGANVHTNSYNWTLPRSGDEACIDHGNCTCVLRIRYNITLGELTGKEDYYMSGINSPVGPNPTATVGGVNFTLTLNTAQAGRTFQDRSFMFHIAPRPNGVTRSAKIYNLNVRGKRGNIVQTYPATEYDFVPTHLEVAQNDFIHFQWTGCDTNPQNNNGNGRDSTDRSNIVQIADLSKNYPLNDTQLAKTNKLFQDDTLRARMANIDQVNCLSYKDLLAAQTATGTAVNQNTQNCMLLNQAGSRFSGGLVKMSNTGSFYYMSTRNNDFSNRSQKASIKVSGGWPAWKTAVIVVSGVVAIAVGAAAGTVFYAKRNPHSKAAEVVSKVPGLNRI